MKMASSYFQRYLVGYRDEHFVGYEDYIYFRCITKTIVVFSDFCELEIEQPNCSQNWKNIFLSVQLNLYSTVEHFKLSWRKK